MTDETIKSRSLASSGVAGIRVSLASESLGSTADRLASSSPRRSNASTGAADATGAKGA